MGRRGRYYTHVQPKLKEIMMWARDGDSESVIYKRLGVAVSTFEKYKTEHEELKSALAQGKADINFKVENALLKKCLGHKVTEIKTTLNPDGTETITKIVREISPDTTAAKYWLANKAREKWRDRQEIEYKGEMALGVSIIDDIPKE